ncbi:MAG: hypothetical protein BJ554DRAFT_2037 [Olpidium bornovanus]|uniref:Uncharacterized protein n=1 Tax=Olpidium bornovanus TaxID=278681 RepID=A0A8H8DGZ5_9FUNG|nr:MAG: hypothetical protein BJ554DRAFT_2037 [Olpidium bornovanus]
MLSVLLYYFPFLGSLGRGAKGRPKPGCLVAVAVAVAVAAAWAPPAKRGAGRRRRGFQWNRKGDRRRHPAGAANCFDAVRGVLAIKYAERGAYLILCARRRAQLEEAALACQEASLANGFAGRTPSVVTVDVTSIRDVRKLAQHVRVNSDFAGAIDTLVLSSGVISVLPYAELAGFGDSVCRWNRQEQNVEDDDGPLEKAAAADAAFAKVVDVNLFGPVRCARELFPALAAVKGNIVVVSSLSGKIGVPTRSLYSSSKVRLRSDVFMDQSAATPNPHLHHLPPPAQHALHGFFDSFRIEVARHGVHVAIVCPSTVDTDLRAAAVDVASASEASSNPVHGSQRRKETPEGCAKVIVWSSDTRQREVYIPLSYTLLPVFRHFFPALLDRITAARYGY